MNTKNPKCWYGDMYKDDKFAHKRIELCVDLLKPYLKRNIKVLDIGCYTSAILDFLPSNIEYYGVDFDEKALEIAENRGAKVKFVKFDEEEIIFNHQFDIIICTEVLEHLKNPYHLMEQIKRLLNKNGTVLISLPNECTAYHRIMCLIGKGVDLCAFQLFKHLHLPTIKQSKDFVSIFFIIAKKAYFVNPGGRCSRWEGLGRITSKIPYSFWTILARLMPGLFARGVIFLCKTKNNV